MFPTHLKTIMNLSPPNLPKTEVFTTLVCLANIGKVELNLQQIRSLNRLKHNLQYDSSDVLDEVLISSSSTDPVSQERLRLHCEKLKEILRSHSQFVNFNYKTVGIEAGGNVESKEGIVVSIKRGCESCNLEVDVGTEGESVSVERKRRRCGDSHLTPSKFSPLVTENIPLTAVK